MLHTATASRESTLDSRVPARVWCRARRWRVLDRSERDGHVSWRLAQDAELPRLIASPPDEVTQERAALRLVSRRTWMHLALDGAREPPSWWPSHAARLPLTHLAWQYVPSIMVLSGHHRRVLLADDVGMGKTVQAALLLHEIHAREPDAVTLVVCPASLVAQWTAELRRRACIHASVLDAAALRIEAALPRRAVDASRAGTCWLVSIDLLRQPDVIDLLGRTRWTLLVVDEAHACAPGTARLTAVSRVAMSSTRVLLLTATPTAAGTAGAVCLRTIGARSGETPMAVVRRDAALMGRMPRRTRFLDVRLDASHRTLCTRLDEYVARARHESDAAGLLPALVLRRRASSCPAALVRSLERRLLVLGQDAPAEPGLIGLFDQTEDDRDDELMRRRAWEDEGAERHALAALLDAARALPPAGRKLETVARLVRRCREPVVIFTSYVDTLRALRTRLAAHDPIVIHGGLPDALRSEAIAAFVEGRARVLVTTDASAEGLNLHETCRLVVHAEMPPSRRALEQRTGRVDRYGQTRRVHTVVMTSGTIEDMEALDRLRVRAESDNSWLETHTASRCRRTAVAAGALERRPAPSAPRTYVAVCALRRGRWRRTIARLGLDEDTTTLCAGVLQVSGEAELSTSRVPVLVFAGQQTPPARDSRPRRWRDELDVLLARARCLALRVSEWQRDAGRSAQAAAARDRGDLFADAMAGRDVDSVAPVGDTLAASIVPSAVLVRRDRPVDVDALSSAVASAARAVVQRR